jgi:hypothetical protein
LPISPELLTSYGPSSVASSTRRAQVSDWLEATKGTTLTIRDKLILT